jgi:hypothetical protein
MLNGINVVLAINVIPTINVITFINLFPFDRVVVKVGSKLGVKRLQNTSKFGP